MTESRQVEGIKAIMDPAEAARKLGEDSLIGFDTETTGLSPWKSNLALLQFYGDTTGTLAIIQTPGGIVPEPLKDLFKSKKHTFIAHNAVNFDIQFLAMAGVPWRDTNWYDTLVGETVVTSTGRRNISMSLRATAKRKLGVKIDKNIDHGKWAVEELSDEQLTYAASDVINLPALMRAQQENAEETRQLEALEMEMQLMPAMAQMRLNGIPVLPSFMRKWRQEQEALMNQKAGEIRAILGNINIGSHAQLKSAILRVFGIALKSTAVEPLVELYGNPKTPEGLAHIAHLILEYRHPSQRLKTYSEEWMEKFITNDFVHGKFWQCSADTGRITGSEPSLQVWPKDSRYVVGNMDGISIVSCDYSQIEVRVAAELAKDEVLLKQLDEADVHSAIASQVFKVPLADVTKEQRKKAKALSFALLYDGTAMTLYRHSKTSGGDMTYQEAGELEHAFFETFKGLKATRQKARNWASDGRPMAVIRLPNGMRRILVGQNKRASVIINTMVQGTAAIGLKYGVIEADRKGLITTAYGGVGAPVHDELVAWVHNAQAEEFGKELEEAMIFGMKKVLKSAVKAETKVGPFWQA